MNNHCSTGALEILQRLLQVESDFITSGKEDMDGIAGIFHPDVVLHEPESMPYPGDWKGHKGIGQLFKRMQQTWSYLNGENLHAVLNNDVLYMSCTMIGCLRKTGKIVRQPFAQVIRLHDGWIIECTPFYFDTQKIVGLLESQPVELQQTKPELQLIKP